MLVPQPVVLVVLGEPAATMLVPQPVVLVVLVTPAATMLVPQPVVLVVLGEPAATTSALPLAVLVVKATRAAPVVLEPAATTPALLPVALDVLVKFVVQAAVRLAEEPVPLPVVPAVTLFVVMLADLLVKLPAPEITVIKLVLRLRCGVLHVPLLVAAELAHNIVVLAFVMALALPIPADIMLVHLSAVLAALAKPVVLAAQMYVEEPALLSAVLAALAKPVAPIVLLLAAGLALLTAAPVVLEPAAGPAPPLAVLVVL
jgi:hypothetical protein